MSKSNSTQKKRIRLAQNNSTEVETLYTRLMNTSFDDLHPPISTPPQDFDLLDDIKYPTPKIRSHEGEFERLTEITDRCESYHKKFLYASNLQMSAFEEEVMAEKEYIHNSCEVLVKRICEKRDRLIAEISTKEHEIKLFWQKSLEDLEAHTEAVIRSNAENLELVRIDRCEFEDKLAGFTDLISSFYRKVRILEIRGTEDLSREQFTEIRNEAKAVSETRFPVAKGVTENKSFTFNEGEDGTLAMEKLGEILQRQKQRDVDIRKYKENMR